MDIQCPVCRKMYKDRIGDHLVKVHNIKNPDAETIKSGLMHFRYFPADEDNVNKTLSLLREHHYRFEKLRQWW